MKLLGVAALNRRSEAGSATVLVFALLAILVVYLNANQRTLHTAKRELRLLEHKQLKKFQPPPPSKVERP